MLWFVPFLLALLVTAPFVVAPFSRWVDVRLSRIALAAFGEYVYRSEFRHAKQQALLRAAHVGETHRIYASRTLLMAAAAGVVGTLSGVYFAAGFVVAAGFDTNAMLDLFDGPFAFLANLAQLPQLDPARLLGLFVASALIVGPLSAFGTYWARWRYLRAKANARATGIDTTLPRTVAFIYALSRSGMPFTKVIRTLDRNRGVYGEAAAEISVAVRDMDAFSTDVLTALEHMADRTPSDGLEEFSDNLSSVLGSGRNLPNFLHEQYERYRDEAESLQEQYLDLLSTFAEIYVTVLVAGPLFFITVLVVIGLVLSDTLTLIRIVTYVAIPLASFAFIVYIDSITQSLRTTLSTPDGGSELSAGPSSPLAVSDGGHVTDSASGAWERNRERLAAHDSFEPVREWLDDPVGMVLTRPEATLALTLPLGIAWALVRAAPLPPLSTIGNRIAVSLRRPDVFLEGEVVRSLDGPLIEATIGILFIYALVNEIRARRRRAIEKRVPDFLDRLAGVNEAGMTVTESLRRVRGSELGRLGPEIDRLWADVQWGADARSALRRMERRTGSVLVSQAVALITNAMRASGDIAPVLHIAADEAQENRRLRRERQQEMFTYLLVIYISFFVFVGIVTALSVAFIPAIEEASQTIGSDAVSGGVTTGLSGTFGGIGDVDTEAYSLLFFHVAAIQAVCSGFIAGLLGEGTLRDGAKHATVLLAIAYLVAIFLL